MKKKILVLTLSSLFSLPTLAQDLSITVTNLTHGSHLTPLLISAHGEASHIFQLAETASLSLQTMAEGGDISLLAADLNALSADVIENPAAGLLAPGASVSFDMSTQILNTHLSIAAMILPTNDGFTGVDALQIPQAVGTYTYYLDGYDAGTEANDEIINGAGDPGAAGIPADPLAANGTNATGVTTEENNQTVHVHRGVLGDTDSTAGHSDLDSRVHRWINPVTRLVIEVK